MSKKLEWDKTGERFYETGVEKGVLFVYKDGAYGAGVAWNGLTAVNENPSGAEPSPLWADNIKYLNLISNEEMAATIEAYMYPDEFMACDGSANLTAGVVIGQQKRLTFGLAYTTKIGNDVDGSDHGYKIHLLYGCLAAPSQKNYSTVNDSPEANTFSWEVSTTPVSVPGFKPTACITIDSTKVKAAELEKFEKILYGDETTDSKLPMPSELTTIFTNAV